MTTGPSELLAVFAQEGAERVELLNQLLLKLEAAPHDAEVLAQAMRVSHNLKGAAGTTGLGTMSAVAHAIEELISRLRDGRTQPGAELFDRLFQTVDALGTSLAAVARGETDPPELASVLASLEAVLAEKVGSNPAPASTVVGEREFLLGEYDRVRLKVLRKQGKGLLRVELGVPADEAQPDEWARDLLKLIRKSCDVVATVPPETDFAPLATSRELAVLCGTTLTAGELRAELASHGAARCVVEEAELTGAGQAIEQAAAARPRGSLKVDVDRVDNLVDMIGELVITQSMIAHAPEIQAVQSRRVQGFLGQLSRITRGLQDVGLRLRMVPLRGVFQAMARTVRDLGRKASKDVRFVVSGDEVEMDRSVVEGLVDPLVHLLRNAVDHGVEPPEERERQGKDRTATVRLSAYQQGGSIVLEVSDDGRGLDPAAILARAHAMGLVRVGTALSESEIANFIFENGFSTAAKVTEISGRGVGLDIVRRNIEALRGRVSTSSQAGRGTTFKLVLPLTLAIIDGMLVGCGGEHYIIPTLAVVESLRPRGGSVHTLSGQRRMLELRGTMVRLVSLGRLLGVSDACDDPERGLVVIVEGIGHRVGLVVDEVVSQQQVVIKSVDNELGRSRYMSGAAIMPDGRVGLILNIDELTGAGVEGNDSATEGPAPVAAGSSETNA